MAHSGSRVRTHSGTRVRTHEPTYYLPCVQVAVEMARQIRHVDCTSHWVDVKRSDTKCMVKLALSSETAVEAMSRDLLLLIGIDDPHAPRLIAEVDHERKTMACMVSISPDIAEFPTRSQAGPEILVLIDMSESMRTSGALADAKAAALACIDRLPPRTPFNVHGFGSVHHRIFLDAGSSSEPADLRTARRLVRSASASLGGTDLFAVGTLSTRVSMQLSTPASTVAQRCSLTTYSLTTCTIQRRCELQRMAVPSRATCSPNGSSSARATAAATARLHSLTGCTAGARRNRAAPAPSVARGMDAPVLR